MSVNIPETPLKRVVIIGAGFAGLKLAKKLVGSGYQIVLIDKNNYHQFQPLFYQVASAGIEPSSILFPLRKIFQKRKDVYIRVAEVYSIDTEKKEIRTSLDIVWYDYLVIATGVNSNYFGMKNMEQYSIVFIGYPIWWDLAPRIINGALADVLKLNVDVILADGEEE